MTSWSSAFFSVWSLLATVVLPAGLGAQPEPEKPHRVLVLTDIEADPDDSQSMVGLLLYVNRIDVQGLIATTSVHQKTRVAPETIHRIIDAYGLVQARLWKHESGYPAAEEVHGLVKSGLPVFGMEGVGARTRLGGFRGREASSPLFRVVSSAFGVASVPALGPARPRAGREGQPSTGGEE